MLITENTHNAVSRFWTTISPLACGIRTDHPIKGLPLIDDSELGDLTDRHAIEAIGRRPSQEGNLHWGREDRCYRSADDPSDPDRAIQDGWAAFTTSESNSDFAWLVRELDNGTRHVLLYENYAARTAHHMMIHRPELGFQYPFLGGYFADRELIWHRPAVEYDRDTAEYWSSPGKLDDAITITAERYSRRVRTHVERMDAGETIPTAPSQITLTGGGLTIEGPTVSWARYFDIWTQNRRDRERSGADLAALDQCIIGMHDVETEGSSSLVDSTEMAELGGRSLANFSANRSRGGLAIPQPLTFIARTPVWTRPMAHAWADRLHV